MVEEQDPLFLIAPLDLLNLRVQVVVPPLPALLPNPPRQVVCDLGPLLRAILLNQLQDQAIFIFSPGPFDQARVQNLLPPMQALHISPPRQGLRYFLPVLASVLVDCIFKHFVFLFRPVALGVAPRAVDRLLLVLGGAPLVQVLVQQLLLQ